MLKFSNLLKSVFLIITIILSISVINVKSQNLPFNDFQILNAIWAPVDDRSELFELVIDDVRKQGVSFKMTADYETMLHDAGATNELIEAIRTSYKVPPKSLTLPEINIRLKSGNSDSKVKSEVINLLIKDIEERKINGTFTGNMERSLRKNGATDQLIQTIKNNNINKRIRLWGGGDLTEKAIELPQPAFLAGLTGTVDIWVAVNEKGEVKSASPTIRKKLTKPQIDELYNAARNAKFEPKEIAGQPVRVYGIIRYKFN